VANDDDSAGDDEPRRRILDQLLTDSRGVRSGRRNWEPHLHISPRGRELWAACRPGFDAANGAAQPAAYRSAHAGLPPRPRKQGRG
jgi:hypothetical protein